jgi:hypothetical protein
MHFRRKINLNYFVIREDKDLLNCTNIIGEKLSRPATRNCILMNLNLLSKKSICFTSLLLIIVFNIIIGLIEDFQQELKQASKNGYKVKMVLSK